MKNLLLRSIFLLFFAPSVSFAWNDVNMYLKISIRNNTPETCFLTDQHVFKGGISPLLPLPETILSGTENNFFMVDIVGLGGSSISLTYQCGDSHKISFLSQRRSLIEGLYNGQDILEGAILFARDMDATYEIQHGPLIEISSSTPGSIDWILN